MQEVENWGRLPHPRGGRLGGMSRTTIMGLIEAGVIRSALIKRNPKAKRGVRLIFLPDLVSYLKQLSSEDEKETG